MKMTKKESEKPKIKPAVHSKAVPTHKRVFDVVPPGKALALPTSRPVITNHKVLVQDDQFVPGAPPLESDEKRGLLDSKHKVISPLSAPSQPQLSAPPLSDEVKQVLAQETTNPGHLATDQVVEATEPQPMTPSSPSDAPASSAQPPIAAPGPAPISPKANPAFTKTLDELIAETGAPTLDANPEPVELVISHHKHHNGALGFLLMLAATLILVALALNFLLDAELLQTNWNIPRTDML